MSITPEQARARFNAIGDQLLAVVRDVEAEMNGGGKSITARLMVITGIASVLGMHTAVVVPEDPELVEDALREMEGKSDD